MGLSSSQGRLLMLTSRLSDIELQQIMISQRQNQLAAAGQKAAEEYNNAMSNCKIVIKMPNENEKVGYTKEDLTYKNLTQMGYLPTNGAGAVYLKKTETELNAETMLEILYSQLENTTDEAERTAIQEKIEDVQQKDADAKANGETYT